jgi:DNA polymerase I-like protein with 3'-5' exonuclease and polymerase domains
MDTEDQSIEIVIPSSVEEPTPEIALVTDASAEPPKKPRKKRVTKENLSAEDITKTPTEKQAKSKKAKKAPKPKPKKDIRTMFHARLSEIELDKIKKSWMAEKAFHLISDAEELKVWAEGILADTSRHHTFGGETCPVIAVDTETTGLDTRILVDMEEQSDGTWLPIYEVKIDISGICLSPDGIEGIYIPITHEIGDNIDREACAKVLQYLFDRSHLVYYNAKYDKEVLRLCMGIEMRGYPHFEDVQVLAYINDPKADLGDKKKGYTGSSGGLKGMSKSVLKIEQIELDELTKIKAMYCPRSKSFYECKCSAEEKKCKEKGFKHGQKSVYAPFSWVPTDIALWYAAGDAITTWLLWEKMYPLARSRNVPHTIDHDLVDSLTWIERQRFHIDTDRLARTTRGHQKRMMEMEIKLRALALADGFIEKADDEGNVLEDDKFNPGSPKQLQKLFFEIKKYKPTKITDVGNISCDAEVLEDLHKLYPQDAFLTQLLAYRDYAALHPGNLKYDPKDKSARMFLKACVVAGGRLSGAGGKFDEDGGFGLNPQGIKKVESHLMWKVTGNVLEPDEIPVEEIEAYEPEDLHPSCRKDVEEEIEVDGEKQKHTVVKTAPGIINNHIGQYMGYAVCLVPKCTSCADKFGILIHGGKIDANEVTNLRCLFDAPDGWTFFCNDYGNIEVRACLAGETKALIRNKGFSPLRENVGKVSLLNSNSDWVDSEIQSFGVQPLRRVVIGHNKSNVYVYATPQHKWRLADGVEKITDQLVNGDEIPFIQHKRKDFYSSPDYLLGVRHGIIYGDGSRALSDRKGTGDRDHVVACRRELGFKIRLCGADKNLLTPYFDGYKVTYPANYGGDPVVYLYDEFTATHKLKELPDEDETEAYLVGFFRGWFAADGSASGGYYICCGPEEETWLRRVMPQFGYYFLSSTEVSVDTYFCVHCNDQVKTIKPMRRPRVCKVCRTPIKDNAPVVMKTHKFKRGSYECTKRSRSVSLFRPSMMGADFLLPHKLAAFNASKFELHETVRRVELTDRVEEVFCAVVPGTHDFVIENGLLTGNCANITKEPELIKIFLEGDGDHHALTASKIFPEFNDPNITKARRKYLRGLAKIINFALQYGGTEYTIFENMRKEIPDITWEKCQQMVADYKAGVPVYQSWCLKKQRTAKEEKICTTALGRVIDFQSAMETLHLHEPTKEEMKRYWEYRELNKDAEAAKKSGDMEAYAEAKAGADELWKDPETGVRNAMEHGKFIGKIQRVAVNAPLQGVAGDFMRIALNRIRKWALSDPGIAQVFRLHGSVHDEIDFAVKNEYAPFILPRVVRLMKLRKLFASKKWPVPIECDAEYGQSWDVVHHLTGDSDHAPAAWQGIKGCEKYIPDLDDFSVAKVKEVIVAIWSKEEERVGAAVSYMKEHLHPRSHVAIKPALEAKSINEVSKFVKAALQLHEYWVIDETPEGDEGSLETLEQYEQRRGLTLADRGQAPGIGYLGAIPLNAHVVRPTIPILGPREVLEIIEETVTPSLVESTSDECVVPVVEVASEITPSANALQAAEDAIASLQLDMELTKEEVVEVSQCMQVELPPSADEAPVIESSVEEDIFAPMPKYTGTFTTPLKVETPDDGIPEVKTLDVTLAFKFKNTLGFGRNTITYRYQGRLLEARNKALVSIPGDFLVLK